MPIKAPNLISDYITNAPQILDYAQRHGNFVRREKGTKNFRQRLICSLLSGKPVKIEEIRNRDERPGLRPFEEDEEHLFFGRENQIDQLSSKLSQNHFLAVIGASGSGKSSLVKSGLIPVLHSGLCSGVGHGWRIGVFRPGKNPIKNLDCQNDQWF